MSAVGCKNRPDELHSADQDEIMRLFSRLENKTLAYKQENGDRRVLTRVTERLLSLAAQLANTP